MHLTPGVVHNFSQAMHKKIPDSYSKREGGNLTLIESYYKDWFHYSRRPVGIPAVHASIMRDGTLRIFDD